MIEISSILWKICRLKANPQDLPKARSLLLFVVFVGIIIDSFSSSVLIPKLSGLEIVQTVLLYNLVLLSCVYLLLRLIGYAERGMQTITAIAGSGLFISLILLPALLTLNLVVDANNLLLY